MNYIDKLFAGIGGLNLPVSSENALRKRLEHVDFPHLDHLMEVVNEDVTADLQKLAAAICQAANTRLKEQQIRHDQEIEALKARHCEEMTKQKARMRKRMKRIKTEDDYVNNQLLPATHALYKNDKDDLEAIRKLAEKTGQKNAEQVIDDWIHELENREAGGGNHYHGPVTQQTYHAPVEVAVAHAEQVKSQAKPKRNPGWQGEDPLVMQRNQSSRQIPQFYPNIKHKNYEKG